MAKKQRRPAAPTPPTTTAEVEATKAAKGKPEKHPSARGGRETVDALVIAFAMAFLIRTFQAEQFVIPTGSMAPTLMGAHKDVECSQCGQRYRVNAARENDARELASARQRARQISRTDAKRIVDGSKCVGGACPVCRYVMPIDTDGIESYLAPADKPAGSSLTYPGDRLVVNKYAYSFRDPERWDVVVFKYPGNAQRNYIKRLVGLPGEELRVFHGDLYTRPTGSDEAFAIAAKPSKTVMAMRQLVHDTDHDPARLHQAGWPLRWSGDDAAQVDDAWQVDVSADGDVAQQRYSVKAGDRTAWLRYRHTPTTEPVWDRVGAKPGEKLSVGPQPELIMDFTPYNTEVLGEDVRGLKGKLTLNPTVRPRPGLSERERGVRELQGLSRLGAHWVGDLMLEAELKVASPEGRVTLELVEAGDHFQAVFDLGSGEVSLQRRRFESDQTEIIGTAPTKVRGAGAYDLRLANFDDTLTLWIDGSKVAVDGGYDRDLGLAARAERLPRTSESDPGDLLPAGVGVAGAEVVVTRLAVWRDIYYLADRDGYLADRNGSSIAGFVTDYQTANLAEDLKAEGDWRPWPEALAGLPLRPEDWRLLAHRRHVEFPLSEDQLFVMGDNSGHSLDARLWAGGNGPDGGVPGGAYLERKQLIGKATWVYWPRAWYTIPVGFGGIRIPIVPNLADVRLVR